MLRLLLLLPSLRLEVGDKKRILFRYNNCRLTNLAAKMNMTKASVQRDAETYLQQKNLIGIDTQGRFLTKEGRELVLNINESRTV